MTDPDLTMDPKRYCRKVHELRKAIAKSAHFKMGDLIEVLPERKTSNNKKIKIDFEKIYNYVELQDIGYGYFDYVSIRGWQLPQRAKHLAESGDIYIGAIWGSVAKWCFIGPLDHNYIVTNGCHRLRIRAGNEQYLPDLLGFLCTEAYAVQMRAFARGSDGLAEVSTEDLKRVLIPRLSVSERQSLSDFVVSLKEGAPDLKGKVNHLMKKGELAFPAVGDRPSHVVLV